MSSEFGGPEFNEVEFNGVLDRFIEDSDSALAVESSALLVSLNSADEGVMIETAALGVTLASADEGVVDEATVGLVQWGQVDVFAAQGADFLAQTDGDRMVAVANSDARAQ